jgi:hypothetical protein
MSEIVGRSSATLARSGFPEDLAYLADCSEGMLDNFILEKMNSAARHSRAIQAEQRAMVDDLARAEAARLIKLLLDDREMLDLLLSRRKIRTRAARGADQAVRARTEADC